MLLPLFTVGAGSRLRSDCGSALVLEGKEEEADGTKAGRDADMVVKVAVVGAGDNVVVSVMIAGRWRRSSRPLVAN